MSKSLGGGRKFKTGPRRRNDDLIARRHRRETVKAIAIRLGSKCQTGDRIIKVTLTLLNGPRP